jgi:hypothetical protein
MAATAARIDLLELQFLHDYNIEHVGQTAYPSQYPVSSQELTGLKNVPCCYICFSTDIRFRTKIRRFRSNAERIRALKLEIFSCRENNFEPY